MQSIARTTIKDTIKDTIKVAITHPSTSLVATPSIGFIGAGAMAEALLRGLSDRFRAEPTRMLSASDPLESRRKAISNILPHVDVMDKNESLVHKSDHIVIAVKPFQVREVLHSIIDYIDPNHHLVISVAAGITTTTLEEDLPEKTRVVRVMPNIACKVGETAAAIVGGKYATPKDIESAQDMVTAGGGLALIVSESQMDAVTGLAGSGPAYVYSFLEAMIEGGVAAGLTWDVSQRLALQTLRGAIKMTEASFSEYTSLSTSGLRAEVCSAGGTTISGIHALERGGFRASIMDAVTAASARSEALRKI